MNYSNLLHMKTITLISRLGVSAMLVFCLSMTQAFGQLCQTDTIFVNAAEGECIASADLIANLSTTCDDGDIFFDYDPDLPTGIPTGSFPLGITDVTVSIGPGCSEIAEPCVMTVSVTPSIACDFPAATRKLRTNGRRGVNPANLAGGMVNPCGIPDLEFDWVGRANNRFTCEDLGTNTYQIEVTSPSYPSLSQVCDVELTILPADISCSLVDTTMYLDDMGMASITAEDLDAGITDGCSELTIAFEAGEDGTFTCDDIGTTQELNIVVTRTVGGVEETDTCVAMIPVQDTLPPMCVVADITVQINEEGASMPLDTMALIGGSTDNCTAFDDLIITVTPSTFECSQVGDNTVTITLEDASGNTSECTATVTVEDNNTIECSVLPDTVYLDAAGMGTLTVFDVDDGTQESTPCLINLSLSRDAFNCDDLAAMPEVNLIVESTTNPALNVECPLEITVLDTLAPICGADPYLVVQLEPGQCDTAYVFDYPAATDACDADPTETPATGAPVSGDVFDIGIHEVMYIVEDESGNTDSCSMTIEILEFIPETVSVKKGLNLSIDEVTCEGYLTVPMAVTGKTGCPDNYDIYRLDENDNRLPNLYTGADIGETFKFEVCFGEGRERICSWGYVTVEYKFPPKLICPEDVTLSCVQALSEAGEPEYEMVNCANVEVELISELPNDIGCDDQFISSYIRTWVAIDEYGNVSKECTQTVYFERTLVSTLLPPPSAVNANSLSCGGIWDKLDNGNPEPTVVGVPRLVTMDNDTVDLYPFDSGVYCNGFVNFRDEDLKSSTDCKRIIKRTWTISEWHCSNPLPQTFEQFIKIVDLDSPTVIVPDDVTISTSSFSCTADYVIDPPYAVDVCNNDAFTYDVRAGDTFIADYKGETIELPAGKHKVNIVVYDACGNPQEVDYEVTVEDNAQPTPLCITHTVEGIGRTGEGYMTTRSIDNGSYDECGPVTLSIARMDDPGFDDLTGFGERIKLTCDDVGTTVMVGLLVTDEGGLTNMCMVSVDVQDKLPPRMVCPEDTSVDCGYAYDPANLGQYFGEVDIVDNCPSKNTLIDTLAGELNACGNGTIERHITLIDANGVQVQTCTQYITFRSGTPLVEDSIIWPVLEDNVFEGCIQDLPQLGAPTFPEGTCMQVGMRYEDEVYPFEGNAACQKVIRTWYIIDWCRDRREKGGALNPFTHQQTIKLINTVDPTFTSVPKDTVICSYAADCGGLTLTSYLTAVATDDCTADEDLYTRFVVRDADDVIVNRGDGLDANGFYNLGSYEVEYIVEDRCGNAVATKTTFEIRNCKTPTPYCKNGLSTSLTAMDTNGDGKPDTEMSMLTADFFDAGSYHVCGYDVTVSFSADVNDTLLVLGCGDLGTKKVQIWATDENGNQDYCETFIEVEDNNGVDISCLEGAEVSGAVFLKSKTQVPGVSVALEGAETTDRMTDDEGAYTFGRMSKGGKYAVIPLKEDGLLKGVNTLDLVHIQRHVLKLQEFDNPYTLVAADINNDGKIKSNDLLALRKAILGASKVFPNNTSWRFVDANYTFEDEQNAQAENFDEQYAIDALNEDMEIDFIGMKIGDVDGSVEYELISDNIESRYNESMDLSIVDQYVTAGEVVQISINATEAMEIFGLQLGLTFDDLEVVSVAGLSSESYVIESDVLKVADAHAEMKQFAEDAAVFHVSVKAKKSGYLSELVSLDADELTSEIYSGLNEIKDVNITWRSEEVRIAQLEASPASPNPWSTSTDIEVSLPTSGMVRTTVRDASGRLVYNVSQYMNAGNNRITLTSEDVSALGVLYYEIVSGTDAVQGKLIHIE